MAVLDLDNTQGGGHGAETITVREVGRQQDSVYTVIVHNYVATRRA